MKIVVTGGSGLFGQVVVSELFKAGYNVLSLDRKPHAGGFRPSWAIDLLQSGHIYEACVKADAVIHLAAHNAPNLASDGITFNDNVRMTYNVVKAASDIGIRRVVVASSIAAYGFLYGVHETSPDYLPIDEDHRCRPTDPYGLSKVVGETICDSFACSGLDIVSLRLPGINYDPSYQRIQGFMASPGDRRRGFWSYIDARDAAAAVRLSIETPLRGHRIFNIAAPTSNMREPTLELIRRFYPDVKDIRQKADTNWSGLSSQRAEQELGFVPEYTWERYLSA